MEHKLAITDFDRQTIPSEILFIKSIIPFLDFSIQKNLSPLIRAYELKSTIKYYNEPSNLRFEACSSKPHISVNNPIKDILGNPCIYNTILPYCPDNIKKIIDTYKTYSEMSDLLGNNKQLYEDFYNQLNELNI